MQPEARMSSFTVRMELNGDDFAAVHLNGGAARSLIADLQPVLARAGELDGEKNDLHLHAHGRVAGGHNARAVQLLGVEMREVGAGDVGGVGFELGFGTRTHNLGF